MYANMPLAPGRSIETPRTNAIERNDVPGWIKDQMPVPTRTIPDRIVIMRIKYLLLGESAVTV
jgi:hypothetical protein